MQYQITHNPNTSFLQHEKEQKHHATTDDHVLTSLYLEPSYFSSISNGVVALQVLMSG
jgi:hypothetical protein